MSRQWPEPSPASCPSPTDPALRANPYPEIPYLLCSNMSETVHLGDMLRIWVQCSRRFTTSPQGTAMFPKAQAPLFRQTHSRVPCPSKKRELRELLHTLPAPTSLSGIGCIIALDASWSPSLPLRIGDLNSTDSLLNGWGQWRQSPIPSEQRLPISQDWLMFNCCSYGTLQHFSLQSSHWNICYSHQDLHLWWFHRGPHPRLQGSLQWPFYFLLCSILRDLWGDVCMRGGWGGFWLPFLLLLYIHIYMYTHTHTHTHICKHNGI